MNNQFKNEVIDGLSQSQKKLSSKYFYDDEGSRIFQEIMKMDDYYLTNKELEIFTEQGGDIYDSLHFKMPFNVIELGAGDGIKTAQLIRHLLEKNAAFTYTPIDISAEANEMLSKKLTADFPQLKIDPQTGDYFEVLKDFKKRDQPVLLLFIGSNIGNYRENEVNNLFRLFHQSLKQGDKLLVGVDLKKNPAIIRNAYFDSEGITKRFNLNLLKRINRELNANFDLDKFDFYVSYDPQNGEVRSYLVSQIQQEVTIGAADKVVKFTAGETIWTELSKKYDLEELTAKLAEADFTLTKHYTDKDNYFTDSLFTRQ